ncbi:hypothetical protein DPMN_145358 [Dreissena polymorpha]|uniref:Tetratricopeptide repeat protein 19, mitochondrial n=2 Tax=Dreissena polymorpha TaxID=45954 RepID=A0A9D4F9Q3_DREPO|nr:hypothetical protein DPMN_145358 [Dreissena polymorpha]
MHLNHRVFIYDQIADMMLDIGDYKNAELVFKDTMKLALQLGMAEDDNAMIEMSLKLATIYLYTGRMDIGVVGIRHCIAEQEKKLGAKNEEKEVDKNVAKDTKAALEEEQNTKVLLGKAYRHYGNYHMQLREFKEGKEMMAKALKVSQDVLGENDDTSFVIMNDMATCEILLENYKDAENLLKEAVVNSGRVKSSVQSALLSNLGALYIRTSRYEEAEHACQRGLTVAEKANDRMLMLPCKACLMKLQSLKKKVENDKEDDDED